MSDSQALFPEWELCANCNHARQDHVDNKCPFDSTEFRGMICECGHSDWSHAGWDFDKKCFSCSCEKFVLEER